MISVLILTYNEEVNLPSCVKSVAWSDDVLVLDSFSTDRTVTIAQMAGARVLQNRFVDFAQQRNFGLQNGSLKHDWVLHLDADEVVTPELQAELVAVARQDALPAYRLASKMMFQGRWLKYSGLYPSYQVRFGRRDKLTFVQVGHGQRENLPADQVGTLRHALEHYSFAKGMDEWRRKHEGYAAAEARHAVQSAGAALDWPGVVSCRDPLRRRRALKALSQRLPFRPLLRFAYMYLLRLGFLDGLAGYKYCRLLACYEAMIVKRSDELRCATVAAQSSPKQ